MIQIESICLPVSKANIGDRVQMNASVINFDSPETGTDLAIWMNMKVGDYHFEGLIITFNSTYV